jgi:DNA repair exonuclease SbcCD ATPase subunit
MFSNMFTTAEPAIDSKSEIDELMSEIASMTSQLAEARKELDIVQEKLQASEAQNQQLEMHMSDLVSTREEESKELKELRESNTYLKQEDAKLRASMDLMKAVFAQMHLKSKEGQKGISLITEERNLLLEENARLRSMQDQSHTQKNASVLATSLEAARAEVSEFRRAQMKSEKIVRQLKTELRELRSVSRSDPPCESTSANRKNLLGHLERRMNNPFKREHDQREPDNTRELSNKREADDDDEEYSTDDSDDDTMALFNEEVANVRNFTRNFCAGY